MTRLRIDAAFAIAGRGVLLAFVEPEDDAIAVAPAVMLAITAANGVTARARLRSVVPFPVADASKAGRSGLLIVWEGPGIDPPDLTGGTFAVEGPAT